MFILILVCTGCGSSSTVVPREDPLKTQAKVIERAIADRDKDKALTHFIDASMLESNGDFAPAILEYQDALRFDRDPAIFYALAKNYSMLRKYDVAAENGREAVRMDSTNITFRETLADIYFSAGQLSAAADEYGKILAIDSNRTQSMHTLALLTERKNVLQALELYDRILARNGPSWDVLLRIGELNASLRRFDKAIAAFQQLLKIDSGNEAIGRTIAELYFNAGEYDSAAALYGELSRATPQDTELRGALAEVYIHQGLWSRAEQEFRIMLKADSVSADTRFKIASAYYLQTQKDSTLLSATIEQFTLFHDQYPDDWRPYLYLGVLHRQKKEYAHAQRSLERAVASASWNVEAWWQLGWVYFEQDSVAQAIGTMLRAARVLPKEFRVHLLLGIAYSRAQRLRDAVVALERAVELEPEDVNALSSLGMAYDAVKNYLKSDSTYERALRVDPHYALVLNNYAYSLSERGVMLDRALAMSTEALAKDSLNASYLDTYGWIFFKLGDYAIAEQYVRKAIAVGDTSAAVLEHLGDVYAKMNKMERAVLYWKKALDLDKANTSLRQKIEQGNP